MQLEGQMSHSIKENLRLFNNHRRYWKSLNLCQSHQCRILNIEPWKVEGRVQCHDRQPWQPFSNLCQVAGRLKSHSTTLLHRLVAKWCHISKMAAPGKEIFWLHFCIATRRWDTLSIFTRSQWSCTYRYYLSCFKAPWWCGGSVLSLLVYRLQAIF